MTGQTFTNYLKVPIDSKNRYVQDGMQEAGQGPKVYVSEDANTNGLQRCTMVDDFGFDLSERTKNYDASSYYNGSSRPPSVTKPMRPLTSQTVAAVPQQDLDESGEVPVVRAHRAQELTAEPLAQEPARIPKPKLHTPTQKRAAAQMR